MSGPRVATSVKKVIALSPPSAKTTLPVPDAVNDSRAHELRPGGRGEVIQGTILRAGADSYSYLVDILTHTISCISMMTAGAGQHRGGGDVAIYSEGTQVLVHVAFPSATSGIILGAVPSIDIVPEVGADALPVDPVWEPESGVGEVCDDAYKSVFVGKDDPLKTRAPYRRPSDMLPGSMGFVNEYTTGVVAQGPVTTMKAGDGAQVRVSALDDQVRVVSGHFQHINALGVTETFNDCGYLSGEFTMAMHQQERIGCGLPIGDETVKWEKDYNDGKSKGKDSMITPKQERSIPQKRFSAFFGFLGDIISFFVGKPDKGFSAPARAGDMSRDQGLMSMQLGSSGRVHARSAAGFMLERWDRIPVPTRLRHAGDPAGDRMHEEKPEKKEPFNFIKDHPYGRSLELRDAEAWRTKMDYFRLYERSTANEMKDFYIPEEDELTCPDDNYEEARDDLGVENFKDYDKRKAFIGLEPDGSIILRDAWGSEICMRGGSIVITAAKQIDVRSGRSTIITGGDDVIVKAKKSVDITATDNDVRIKGDQNVQIVGGSDDTFLGGGVLIESLSKYDSNQYYGDTEGEDVRSCGIILKAGKSRVLTMGETVHVAADKDVLIETIGGESPENGKVTISAANVFASASKQVSFIAGTEDNDNAAVTLFRGNAMLSGKTAYLVGGTSTQVFKGTKAMGGTWVDVGTDVYDISNTTHKRMSELFQSDELLGPFPGDVRDAIKFTYRTSEQYGTTKPVDAGMEKFYTYQPFWAYWASTGAGKKILGETEWWEEKRINGEYPWPGKAAYEGSTYVRMKKEGNMDTEEDLPKPRNEVKSASGGLSAMSFSKFETLKG